MTELVLRAASGAEAGRGRLLDVATAYYNLPDRYADIVAGAGARCRLLMASPAAHGFAGAKGVSAALPLAYALLPHSYRLHQKAVRAAWFSHSALTCLVAVLLLQHLVLCQRSHRASAGHHSHRYPGEVDDCVNSYR